METTENNTWLDFVTVVFQQIAEKSSNAKVAVRNVKTALQMVQDKRTEKGLPAMSDSEQSIFQELVVFIKRIPKIIETTNLLYQSYTRISEKIQTLQQKLAQRRYFYNLFYKKKITIEKEIEALQEEQMCLNEYICTPTASQDWQCMRQAYEKMCLLLLYEYEREVMINYTSELLQRVFRAKE